MRRLSWSWVLVAASWIACPGYAQEPLLNQVYSEGVHQFHRHEYDIARATFDHAISNGSRDPRVYYFRGLTGLMMGCELEAEEDFRMAATLEVEGAGTYNIGRALERIQGYTRLRLERIRRDTMIALSQQRPALPIPGQQSPTIPDFGRDLPRGGDPFADDEGPVLEILPQDEPAAEPGPGDETPAEIQPDDDPFGEGAGATEPAPDAAPKQPPAAEPAAPADDPFGADNLFGEDPDDPFQ